MRFARIAAVVSIGTVVLLAGCSSSSSPKTTASSTPTVATTAPTNAPRSSAQEAPNTSVLSQYPAWSKKFETLATAYADDLAAGNYSAAAGHLDEIAALAAAGKKLPATGNAKADAEWQGAMDDLSAFAALSRQAVRTQDADKLMDSLDLLTNVQNHITAFVNAYTG